MFSSSTFENVHENTKPSKLMVGGAATTCMMVICRPGDFFGEHSLNTSQTESRVTVVAEAELQCFVLPRAAFRELLEKDSAEPHSPRFNPGSLVIKTLEQEVVALAAGGNSRRSEEMSVVLEDLRQIRSIGACAASNSR